MPEIFQEEKMTTYDQKFSDIIRIYNISKDQVEALLSGEITVQRLLEKNNNYVQGDNEFARLRLEFEIAELRKLKNKV